MRLAVGALVSMLVGACGGGGDGGDDGAAPPAAPPATGTFVVDTVVADALVATGIPRDAAEFVAAARLETTSAEPTKVGYLQTFPNGATRAVTVTYVIDQSYTPSDGEAAAAGATQLFAKNYTTSSTADTVENRLQYFVPYDAMPEELRASLQATRSAAQREQPQAAEQSGATVYVVETVKEGVDVGIGSLLDYVKDHGMPKTGKSLGALFTIASALSDLTGAFDLKTETEQSRDELDSLHGCALNPTSILAQSDPNYARDTGDSIDAARSELEQVAAVRFLNQLIETSAGLHPASALAAVGAKPVFVWNEQTLKDYSSNTIMREARDAVVPCAYPLNATFAYSYTSTWSLCDDICHQYQESATANVTILLEPTVFGGYIAGAASTATLSMEDSDSLTDSRALNPPYHVSHRLQASSNAPVLHKTGGYPPEPPEGAQIKDFAERARGKQTIDFNVSDSVLADFSTTDVSSLNGQPTTLTKTRQFNQLIPVQCKFEFVDTATGGSYFSVREWMIGPYYNGRGAPTAKESCTLTVSPVKPG